MRQFYNVGRRCKQHLTFLWRQRRVLFYACLSLNLIRLALWLFPFKAVRQQLAHVSAKWGPDSSSHLVAMNTILWAVTMAGHYTPGGSKCLVNALTTQLLLNRYGYSHQLHIGVALGQGQSLEAHAWIECEGRVIMGDLTDLNRFKSLANTGITL